MPKRLDIQAAPVRELRDLTRLVQRAPGFPEVLAALKNGRSARSTAPGARPARSPRPRSGCTPRPAGGRAGPRRRRRRLPRRRGDLRRVAPEVFPAWDRLPREAGAGRRGLRPAAPGASSGWPAPTPAAVRRRADPGAACSRCRRPRSWPGRSRTVRVGDVVAGRGADRLAGRARDDPRRGGRGRRRVQPPRRHPRRLPARRLRARSASSSSATRSSRSARSTPRPSARSAAGTRSTLTACPPLDGDDLVGLGHVADAFPEGTWVALVEPNDLREEGRHYLGRVDDPRGLFTVESTFARLLKRPSITLSTLAADSLETTCHLRVESVERFSGELTKVKAELDGAAARRPRPDRLPQRGRGRAAGRGLRRHGDRRRRAGCT